MLQEQAKLFSRLHKLVEYILVCLAFGAAIELHHMEGVTAFIRNLTGIAGPTEIYGYNYYTFYILTGSLYWVLAIRSCNGYHSVRKATYWQLTWIIVKAVLLASILFGAILYIIHAQQFNRGLFLLVVVISLVFLLLERYCLLFVLHYMRRRGYNYRQFLVVGSGPRACRLARDIEAQQEWGLRILGFVDAPERVGMKVNNSEVIGAFDDLEKILDDNVVDEVIFCLPRKWMDGLEQYIFICEKVGVKVHLALDLFNTVIAKPKLSRFSAIPVLSLESTPSQPVGLFIKRCMDIALSAIALIVLSPLFLLIIAALKLTSPGPVIFKQLRSGKNGRNFTMYKFRTMVVGAEQLLDKIKNLNESKGPVFHSRSDPRVTKVGRIIRQLSLDELPQLWNVLIGDMSLVGPRPPLFKEVKQYERWQRRRLSFRPGIVCLWQVMKRYQPDFEEWVKMDLEYIDNWSLSLDIKIMLLTIPALFKGLLHWKKT